jgi:glutamate/tyrosine decarboxylase-like PLP-dependent enzyme
MEDEIVAMSLSLFRAPPGAVGSFTSGGTESLFLAVKSARDHFRATRGTQVHPKMVLPRTAHPALDKAAQYLHVDVVRVNTGADLRADVAQMAQAIDERTMMIVGSAPCYPFGVYDPIERLGELARERRVWLHVDACLGGFLGPFARDEGYSIPDFEFSIEGVCSLSADLHKFGMAARGASVVLYRTATLKSYQRFKFDNWPRGSYSTETFQGSRPGGAVASAWAVMQYLGRKGYRNLAKGVMESARRLRRGLERIEGLEVLTPSELNIVVYRSTDRSVDINAVGDALAERNWFVGRMRDPAALHFAVNPVHAPIVEEYLLDVDKAVRQVRASGRIGRADENTY